MSVQKALVLDGKSASVVNDRPIPKLRPGYILVKVKAVALNPTDWKFMAYINTAGAIGGCDFAGIVEQTGEGYEKEWNVGDRIAGFAHGNNRLQLDDGAFAEHILVRADVALRIPDDMTFEAAATLGVASNTVGQGLFSRQGLGLDGPLNPNKNGEKLFIYGGSTATGAMGIQMAKLAGYKVYTTCSPENFEFVKSLGAVEAFDYNDPQSITQIKNLVGEGFKYVWNIINQSSSVEYCMQIITSGGYYRSFSPNSPPRKDVNAGFTVAYTMLGEPVEKSPVFTKLDTSEDYEDGKAFVKVFEKILWDGSIKVHPYTVSHEGIDGILGGLELLKDNKVGRKKLVYAL